MLSPAPALKPFVCTLGLLLALLAPTRVDAAVFTLVWDPVPDVAGYVVHYGTASRQYSRIVDVGDRTSFIFNAPTAGRYYFAVHTYDADGITSALSTEVNTLVEATPETAATLDMVPRPSSAGVTGIDVAFDPVSRRYLLTYASGGESWILMLDVWGAAIGEPQSITAAASGVQPRVAAGGGKFVVVYTDTTAGTRVARFVEPGVSVPTLGGTYTLGPATPATDATDSPGAGVTYDFTDNAFVAVWENRGSVFARAISADGRTDVAVNLTADAPSADCIYARPEIAWDDSLHRGVVLGSREGASCAQAGVWTRIVGYYGTGVFAQSELRVVSGAPGPRNSLRIAYTNLQNRFLSLWSEPQGAVTTLAYRLADATGGLSAASAILSGGALTPESEDDSYTENAVALDAAGTFSIVSHANPAAGTTAGQLYLRRINGDGILVGSLHPLPASGIRTRVALTSNAVTRQLLAAYLDANSHIRALAIGSRVPTVVTANASRKTVSLAQSTTVTATATGGAAPYEFAFWRYDVARARWFAAQSYSTSSTVTWTPTSGDAGEHIIQVWARSIGSTGDAEAWQNVSVGVTPPEPLSVRLTVSPAFPISAGTSVALTATPSGGSGPAEYQFWIYNVGTGKWTVGAPYSPATTYNWTPPASGVYAVQVWARTIGSTASYEAWTRSDDLSVNAPAPVTVRSLTATATTVTPGTSVTWTAAATGGFGPLEYQFWKYNQDLGTWTIVQGYSTSAAFSWTPAASDGGSYSIQVWVRSAGSTSSYEAWLPSNTLVVTNSVAVSQITSNTALRKVNNPITYTASATRIAGTLEYQFWVYSVTTGTWQLARPYNTSSSFSWTPPAAGSYALQVWVRTVGNPRSYEAWLGTGPFTITP